MFGGSGDRHRNERSQRSNAAADDAVRFCLLPAIAIVAGVLGYAVVRGIIMSFFASRSGSLVSPSCGSTITLPCSPRTDFRNSLVISLIFVVATILIGMLLSLVHALALNQIKFARSFFRAIALIPYLVSGVAAAVMWRFMFTGDNAIVSQLMGLLGLSTVSWLADSNKALIVITTANVWFIAPFATLILLAGLQTIDPETLCRKPRLMAQTDGRNSCTSRSPPLCQCYRWR